MLEGEAMYYEERVIDGVLHYRTTPGQDWTKRTDVELTAMLIEARKERNSLAAQQEEGLRKPRLCSNGSAF